MRFSLRTLLLVPLAFLIAVLLSINSWNPNCLKYYADMIAVEERQTHATRAIFLTPLVFGGMLVLGRFRNYLESCQSPDYRSS